MAEEAKRDRLHLRLDARTKHVLERAAAYEGQSLSQFVLANAVAAAEQAIRKHETTTLAAEDWSVFYAALIAPPKPAPGLKAAAQRRPGGAGD